MRLYVIQLFAILAIWLSMFFPGLDIALALLYLLIIWWEADHSQLSSVQQGIVGFIWQVPALFLSLSILLGLDQSTDFSYYFVFILQLLHTPILPLTTLLPTLVMPDKPLYYYLLFIIAPLLWTVYLLPSLNRKISKQKHKNLNPLA